MPKRPISFSNFREKQLDEGATELNRVFSNMRNAYQSGARYSAKEWFAQMASWFAAID
jgi:hypothetical protein|tara:strand:- start:353 stop:526 length:174 start_codon:yes stop_codon:yes gene_type:complete